MFHIETSHLFCATKQMTGFYMKRNTGLKVVDANVVRRNVCVVNDLFLVIKESLL